jgi:hypothetical protein
MWTCIRCFGIYLVGSVTYFWNCLLIEYLGGLIMHFQVCFWSFSWWQVPICMHSEQPTKNTKCCCVLLWSTIPISYSANVLASVYLICGAVIVLFWAASQLFLFWAASQLLSYDYFRKKWSSHNLVSLFCCCSFFDVLLMISGCLIYKWVSCFQTSFALMPDCSSPDWWVGSNNLTAERVLGATWAFRFHLGLIFPAMRISSGLGFCY